MKRQMIVFVSVLAILIAVIFLIRFSNERDRGKAPRALFDLPEDGIAAMEIVNFTQGFYFKKDVGDWTVKKVKTELSASITESTKTLGAVDAVPEGTPEKADPVKISELLTHLKTLKAGEPVATEKESVGKFQINPHSLHVILYATDGKESGRLYVGKMGPDFMSSFVKKGDSDAVYLVDENLGGFMSYPYEEWLLPEKKDGAAAHAAKPDEAAKTGQKGSAHAASKKQKKR
jgi:hypothetical protein